MCYVIRLVLFAFFLVACGGSADDDADVDPSPTEQPQASPTVGEGEPYNPCRTPFPDGGEWSGASALTYGYSDETTTILWYVTETVGGNQACGDWDGEARLYVSVDGVWGDAPAAYEVSGIRDPGECTDVCVYSVQSVLTEDPAGIVGLIPSSWLEAWASHNQWLPNKLDNSPIQMSTDIVAAYPGLSDSAVGWYMSPIESQPEPVIPPR